MIVSRKSFASIRHIAVEVNINLVVPGCHDTALVVNTSTELINHLRCIFIGRYLKRKTKLCDFLWFSRYFVDIPSSHLGRSSSMPRNRNP